MFYDENFMNFMGYRDSLVQEKVEECLAAASRGETSISFDRGDLTDDEVEDVIKEVRRRLG